MNETYTCAHCGQTFTRDDMTDTSIGLVCSDCLDEHFEQCEHCGGWYEQDAYELAEVTTTGRYRGGCAEYWCSECRDDDAFVCSHCEEWHSNSMLEMTDDRWNGLFICSDCSDYYRFCSDCGAVIHEDATNWGDDDEPYCDSCYSDRADRPIHEYSYKPDPDIRGRRGEDTRTELTFGLELEVDDGEEDKYDTAQSILDAAEGRVYCKRDGSLDNGFEIVSHPGTLAHHTYEMHWANICRLARQAGFKSHDAGTCGLHIHVGRRQLGCHWGYPHDPAPVEAMENNLVILTAKLAADLTTFSRRTQRQLEDWARFPAFDLSLSNDELAYKCRCYVSGSRYQAVNFNNGGTVEFRIFRGSLKRDTIIAAIQLVSNLCLYAKSHSFEECKAVTFADIVAVNPYKELVAYSLSRNLAVPAQVA